MKRLQVEEVESISAQRPAAVILPTTNTQSSDTSSNVSANCAYFLK